MEYDDDLQEKMDELRQVYAKSLPEKLNAIQTDWDNIQRDPESLAVWTEFIRKIHMLAGSGASFGFPGVSEVAARLERYIRQFREREAAFSSEEATRVAEMLAELHDVSAPDGPAA